MATASVAVRLNAITGEFEKAFSNATRTVSGFERTFGNAASSIQGHQQNINKAFAEFSGDKLTRDAAALSTAINQIGGASKLTESEQRKVNAAVTEAIAKYQALGQQAPKALLDLANATKQVETPTQRLGGFLQSTFAQFTAANLAANAIQNVVGKMGDFVAQGTKLPGLEASFKRLTSGIGQNSSEMLAALQASTRGLVSELDLMQSANKAILLGLPVTTESMGELAKTATVLGKAMGQDATKSLDDLITALGRSSPLILDNLGLTVKVGEANEKYAAQLGKSVEAMTDAEKKMAFYNAAMEAARSKTQQLGEQHLTLTEMIISGWTQIGNVITRASGIANVGIGRVLSSGDNLKQFLKDIAIFGSPGAALVAQSERAAAEAAAAAGGGPRGGRPRSMLQQAREEAAALAELSAAAKSLNTQALKPLTDTQRELAVQFSKGGLSAKDISDQLNTVKTTAGTSEAQISKFLDALKRGSKEGDTFAKSVRRMADEMSDQVPDVKRLQAALDLLQKEGKDTPDTLKRIADAAVDLFRDGGRLTPELLQLALTTGRLSAELLPVRSGLQGIEKEFQDISPAIKASAKEMIDFIGTLNDPNLKGVLGLSGLTLPGEKVGAPKIPEPPKDFAKSWEDALGTISRVLSEIGSQFDSTFGRVAARVATAIGAMAQTIQGFSQIGKGFISTLGGIATGIGAYLQAIAMVEEANRRQPWQMNSFDKFVAEMRAQFGTLSEAFGQLGEAGEEFRRRFQRLLQGGVWRREDMDALIAEFKTVLDDAIKGMERAIEGTNRRSLAFATPFRAAFAELEKLTAQFDKEELKLAKLLLKKPPANDAEAAKYGLDRNSQLFDQFNVTDELQGQIEKNVALIAEMREKMQPEFERLGIFVASTFAAIVKETGDAIGALKQLEPSFKVLQEGVSEFGLTSTATIDELLKSFALINDATLGPIFEAIQATGQIFIGLQGAGYMTAELFQTVSDDIGASFRELEAKGGDVAKAMALSQPVLQKLWEAQQRYGNVTDETTAALLRQAEEQGLVGAHMKDVNQKILDVLIAIADVFGAEIPDALRNMSSAATDAAEEMTDAFGNAAGQIQTDLDRIRAPKITIPVDYDLGNLPDRELRPFDLGGGDGTVYAPASTSGPDASATFVMQVDGRTLAEATVPYIPGEVQRFGLA